MLIKNAEALTAILGRWPSFHDAEVHSVTLNRALPDGPSLEARIHVFTMTSEVDNRGYYISKDHVLVTLHFTHICLEALSDFNEQNVLFELLIRELDPTNHEGYKFAVEFVSSYGCSASFKAGDISVVAVEPYQPLLRVDSPRQLSDSQRQG